MAAQIAAGRRRGAPNGRQLGVAREVVVRLHLVMCARHHVAGRGNHDGAEGQLAALGGQTAWPIASRIAVCRALLSMSGFAKIVSD